MNRPAFVSHLHCDFASTFIDMPGGYRQEVNTAPVIKAVEVMLKDAGKLGLPQANYKLLLLPF